MSKTWKFSQVGITVVDLEKSIEFYSRLLNIGPFVILDFDFENYHYLGKPADAPKARYAICYSGDIQIELVQPVGETPNPHQDFLSRHPEGVMHYGGPWARDMAEYEAQREHLQSQGHQEVQSGFMAASSVQFSYWGQPGVYPLIEIATAGQPALIPVMQKIRDAAQDWDGKRLSIEASELFAA